MEAPPAAQGMARKARPAPPWKDGASRRAPKTAEAKAWAAANLTADEGRGLGSHCYVIYCELFGGGNCVTRGTPCCCVYNLECGDACLCPLLPVPFGCCTTLAYDTPGRFWTNIKRDTVLMRLNPDDPGTLSCFSGNCLCCTCKRL